jgi:uncharacterized protein involved in exopolysaccharide biosynthesis
MNTTFKFDRSDFRAHYEDVSAHTLRSIGRHRGLIASLVAIAIAIALIIIPLMPRKYSAEALIYPDLFSREGKAVALASVDAAAIVTSEARLIRSDAILRAVVKRLGLDPVASTSDSWAMQGLDWVRAMFLPETRNHSSFDRKVAMLRNQVEVMNDTRSYLISISFKAPSADEAARVVNAFAVEYLRDKAIQRKLDTVNSAEAELGRQLAVYGDKHPKTLQAAEGLNAARASLEAAMSPQDGGQNEVTSDQSVKLAVPNRTPTSPKGFVILGLSFLSALLAGIGLAIWCDRGDVGPAESSGALSSHHAASTRKHTLGHQPDR